MMKQSIFLFALLVSTVHSTVAQLRVSDLTEPSAKVQRAVDSVYNALTTRQRVGQMVVVAAGSLGISEKELDHLISNDLVGGVIFLGGTAEEFKVMKKSFDAKADIPLLYSIDAEPSLMSRKLRNIPSFAKTNTLTDSFKMDSAVQLIDSHLMDLGVTINYAPVCDLTPKNEAIGNRSLGKNVDTVVELSQVFVERSLQDGILPVIKHFPGHGNVQGDTHERLVYIDGEFQELEVFARMVELEVPCVMVGHIAIVNNPYASDMPATCSRRAVTDLLRDSLGFEGLVVTDALNMGAVSNIKNAGYLAMKAGCDMILMPIDAETVVDKAVEKIKEDDEFALQLEASIKRILTLKYLQGLIQ